MNILIVGLGNFGKKYLNLLNKLNDLKKDIKYNIYVLRHSKIKSMNEDLIFSKFNIKKFYYSLDDTNSINFDAVIITNPSTFHVEIANYFINNNISCLIEKPLSNSYEKSLKLISNNCYIQIGYLLRYSSMYQYLKDYNKFIGKLLLVKINVGQYLPDWREYDYKDSVSSKNDLGGGVLLELSHDINYLVGFLDIESYSIKSSVGRISDLDIDVEDYCFFVMDLKLKSKEKVVVSVNLDMIDKDSNRTCKLIGEDGSMYLDFISKKISIKNKEDNFDKSFVDENLLELQLKDFLDKVRNNTDSNINDIEESQLTLKIIDDIKSLQ